MFPSKTLWTILSTTALLAFAAGGAVGEEPDPPVTVTVLGQTCEVHKDPNATSGCHPATNETGGNGTKPPTNDTKPPTNETKPPKNETQPPTNDTKPPTNDTKPPTNETKPPKNETQPPANDTLPFSAPAPPGVLAPIPLAARDVGIPDAKRDDLVQVA